MEDKRAHHGDMPITIEQMFIERYAEMEQRMQDLREENEALENRLRVSDGFVDQRRHLNAVMVSVIGSYELFLYERDNNWRDLDVEGLQALLEKSNVELLSLCESTEIGCSYSRNKIIEVKKLKFPFTLDFTTYRGTEHFAYSPEYDKCALVDIGSGELKKWCPESDIGDLERLALEAVREMIADRIIEVRQKESENED